MAGPHAKPAPRVDAGSARDGHDGSVTVPFEAGAVLLVPERDGSAPGPVRLVYAKRGEALPVPAGRYRVKNYAVETKVKEQYWALSGSGPDGRAVEVKAGAAAELPIDTRIHLTTRAMRHGASVQVSLMIQGDSHQGLSILRGDARPTPTYVLKDAAGKTVAEGTLAYG